MSVSAPETPELLTKTTKSVSTLTASKRTKLEYEEKLQKDELVLGPCINVASKAWSNFGFIYNKSNEWIKPYRHGQTA